jgi:hypothetical protein
MQSSPGRRGCREADDISQPSLTALPILAFRCMPACWLGVASRYLRRRGTRGGWRGGNSIDHIDKVDFIIGAYGTALTAPAMPIVIQRKKTFVGLLGLAVNSQFNYPNYFAMIPSGPDAKPAFTKGFFDVAVRQEPKPQTVAIVAADQEFSRNAADGARENMKQSGLKLTCK